MSLLWLAELSDISITPPRHLFYLSNQLLLQILGWTDGLTLLRVTRVSKLFRMLTQDDRLWKVVSRREFAIPHDRLLHQIGLHNSRVTCWREAWKELYLNKRKKKAEEAVQVPRAAFTKFLSNVERCKTHIMKHRREAKLILERIVALIKPRFARTVEEIVERYRQKYGQLYISGQILKMRVFCAALLEMSSDYNSVTTRFLPLGRKLISGGDFKDLVIFSEDIDDEPQSASRPTTMTYSQAREKIEQLLKEAPDNRLLLSSLGDEFTATIGMRFDEAVGVGRLVDFIKMYPDVFYLSREKRHGPLTVELLPAGWSTAPGYEGPPVPKVEITRDDWEASSSSSDSDADADQPLKRSRMA